MSMMERLINEIRPGPSDDIVNEYLSSRTAFRGESYTKHYNQNEEFFLTLALPYEVPSFPIHHDIRLAKPSDDYVSGIRTWIKGFIETAPPFFADLTYFFDPGEVLKPCMFKLYRFDEEFFLFLLRIDLSYRPLESVCVKNGTNDRTAVYRTKRLYLECDFIPLESVNFENGHVLSFIIRQTISQTWIGETGKGYMVRGIWMDTELGKFFTKLLLPAGKRSYPYYPFTCKYKTVCLTVADPDKEWRRRLLPYLHRAMDFLRPSMLDIEEALRNNTFSENLAIFKSLKAKVPETFYQPWVNLSLKPYLNENDQKEYLLDI